MDWLFSGQFCCIFRFEWQQNQVVAPVGADHGVGPLITFFDKHLSQFADGWVSFPCHYLYNSPHHLAKGCFCGRGRAESATQIPAYHASGRCATDRC